MYGMDFFQSEVGEFHKIYMYFPTVMPTPLILSYRYMNIFMNMCYRLHETYYWSIWVCELYSKYHNY